MVKMVEAFPDAFAACLTRNFTATMYDLKEWDPKSVTFIYPSLNNRERMSN
jgi:hypothetical protein